MATVIRPVKGKRDFYPEQSMLEYYNSGKELDRLAKGIGPLELVRTQELIARYLPPSPATVYDIGGAHGTYAFWLAGLGYQVQLLDAVPMHIEHARKAGEQPSSPQLAGMHVGDARSLPFADASADAALLFGPLYHLTEEADRLTAIREAGRALKPGGLLFAVAIACYASSMVGLIHGWMWDADYLAMCEGEMTTGQHVRPASLPWSFNTAFFHHPSVLMAELQAGGFRCDGIFGIHGPGWNVPDFTGSWQNPAHREAILRIAQLTERDPMLSPHMMAVAWSQPQ